MTQSTIKIISPGRNPADSLAGKRFRIDDGQSELPAGAYVLTLQVLDESGLQFIDGPSFMGDYVTIKDELAVLIIDTQQVAW